MTMTADQIAQWINQNPDSATYPGAGSRVSMSNSALLGDPNNFSGTFDPNQAMFDGQTLSSMSTADQMTILGSQAASGITQNGQPVSPQMSGQYLNNMASYQSTTGGGLLSGLPEFLGMAAAIGLGGYALGAFGSVGALGDAAGASAAGGSVAGSVGSGGLLDSAIAGGSIGGAAGVGGGAATAAGVGGAATAWDSAAPLLLDAGGAGGLAAGGGAAAAAGTDAGFGATSIGTVGDLSGAAAGMTDPGLGALSISGPAAGGLGSLGAGSVLSGGGGLSSLAGLGGIAQLASGVLGLGAASQLNSGASQNAAMANPLAPYQPGWASMLNQLVMNPTASLPQSPGYQAGMQAVGRSMSSQGYQGSGNMMNAMLQYGGNIYNQQVGQLAGLSTMNATGAAQIAQTGQTNATQLQGQALNSLASGAILAGNAFGGGGGNYTVSGG